MAITKHNRFVNKNLGDIHDGLSRLRNEIDLGYAKRYKEAERLYSTLVTALESLDFLLDPREDSRRRKI